MLSLVIGFETFAAGCSGTVELLTFVFVRWCIQCCGNLQPLDTDHQQLFFLFFWIGGEAQIHIIPFMLFSYCLTSGLDFISKLVNVMVLSGQHLNRHSAQNLPVECET